MRIAIYHNLMSGGAKRALYETTRRLVKYHAIDVYTLSGSEHAFCDLRPFVNNYRYFDFETLPLLSSPFGTLNHGIRTADIVRLRPIQRRLAVEIDRNQYDVAFIYASDKLTNGPILLQYLSTPTVCYCNDPLRTLYDPPIPRPYSQLTGIRHVVDSVNVSRWLYNKLLRYEDRRSLQAANKVLVNSYFSRETIYRVYGIQPSVCYLGIDSTVFQDRSLDREAYVLSVGAVNPVKGYDFIIRSLALVPSEIRPPLVIVGNFAVSEEKNFLLELANEVGVSVDFRVMIGTSELVDLYNRAQMTLYAPVLEPFGFVPLESMACGTPVVGVAEGGVRESIRHGETGLLTDRTPEAFARAITTLLEAPDYLERLGEQGIGYVQQQWSWDRSVQNLERHLYQVAGIDDPVSEAPRTTG